MILKLSHEVHNFTTVITKPLYMNNGLIISSSFSDISELKSMAPCNWSSIGTANFCQLPISRLLSEAQLLPVTLDWPRKWLILPFDHN